MSPNYYIQGAPFGTMWGLIISGVLMAPANNGRLAGKVSDGVSTKLIGQPMLYLSEGTLYEMQLDQDGRKVKLSINYR